MLACGPCNDSKMIQVDTPPVTVVETREQRRERRKKERSEQVENFPWKVCIAAKMYISIVPGRLQIGARDCTLGSQCSSRSHERSLQDPLCGQSQLLHQVPCIHSFNLKPFDKLLFLSESKLKREFEQYGTVKSIRMVMSTKDTKPRGYAFIEYEHEKDMHCKYLMWKPEFNFCCNGVF